MTDRMRGRTAGALLAMAVSLLAWPHAARADDAPQAIPMTGMSAVGMQVVRRNQYNYEPNAFKEGDTYHLYWCGGVAGDFVLHAQSKSLKGPWRSARTPLANFLDTSLKPSHVPGAFDSTQTCDPTVIKLFGYYYLYYSGLGDPGSMTSIGVAVSRDPVHFSRLAGGRPIVNASLSNPRWQASGLGYGAGQPTALYMAPYVYLAFTDTTAKGSNPINGAGQYVMRSPDPAFQSGVQELTASGWVDRSPGTRTGEYSIMESFAVDWAYDRRTGKIAVLSAGAKGGLFLRMLDRTSFATIGKGDMPMDWREAPGMLVGPDRTTLDRPTCATMPVAAFAAAGASFDPYSWNAIDVSVASFDLSPFCP